jgi:glucose-6-phosphate isomerase
LVFLSVGKNNEFCYPLRMKYNLNRINAWRDLREVAEPYVSGALDITPDCTPSPILSVEAAGIHADFSRHRLNEDVWQQLQNLLIATEMPARIEDYFSGKPLNSTENRAVLHTALRRPHNNPLMVNGNDLMQQVSSLHGQMHYWVGQLHSNRLTGSNGVPITDIIHIGIGGSDLGPVMAHAALQPYARKDLNVHFVANVDQFYLQQTLSAINPSSTLVIVVSKSFTTYETLSNARIVRSWMLQSGLDQTYCDQHFFAVTAKPSAAEEFGISAQQILPMWDWVGGRFSVWSGVSLVLAMSLGMDHFNDFLAGAYAMDTHFRHADFKENIPVVMALLGVWYGEFLDSPTQAVIPYSEYLRHFSSYLQQLHMESLGKQVNYYGSPVKFNTGRIVWGGVGTHSQHSFHQLLMQGTQLAPVDFILPGYAYSGERNDDLIAHCLAQAEVMWRGTVDAADKTHIDTLAAHKKIVGGRPSTMLMFAQLNPFALGALTALYEHKVFVQSVVWGVNAFDQWGVQQGKLIAHNVLQTLNDPSSVEQADKTTASLLSLFNKRVL